MPWIAPSNAFGAPRAPRYWVIPSSGSFVTADAAVPLATFVGTQSDAGLRSESLSGAGLNSNLPIENLELIVIVADALLALELLNRVARDNLPSLENSGSILSGPVTADATVLLEFLGSLPAGDWPFLLEGLGRAVRDIATQVEQVSTGSVAAGSDGFLSLEMTTPLIADSSASTDWVVSASVVADILGSIEINHYQPRPAPPIPQISGIRVRLLPRRG